MPRLRKAASDYPPRLLGFALTTAAVGAPLVAGAASLAGLRSSSGELAGVGVFFLAAYLSELRPVPIDLQGERLISLAFVFVVASQLLFGWEWSVVIGAFAIAAAMLPQRVGVLRVCFNASVYAIAAGLASLPAVIAGVDGHDSYGRLTSTVFAAGAIFVLTNVALVCCVMALSSGTRFRAVFSEHLRFSGPPFAIMAFIAAQAVIFWNLSPFLLVLVGAPLFTLNLYQWSVVRGRAAAEAASTDSLTGLRNHRAYEHEIEAILAGAAARELQATLCLIDIDRFKQVNDRYGHPSGDEVLRQLGEQLERLAPGWGYRLGGDEFAVVLEQSPAAADELMASLRAEFGACSFEGVAERLTLSVGIATFPDHAADADELKKRADLALYQSKHTGKDRASVYVVTERVPLPAEELEGRLLTVARFASLVDTRDANTSRHSAAVANLAEAIGRVLGLDPEPLEQLRVAGLLHDVGKIAIPDRILCKPGPLDAAELEVVRRHPQTAFDLFEGLDLAPIDTWILHHHEHLDGSGYPCGLAGGEIPYGSRVILVADAFEAMTANRSYRRAISVEAAIAELRDKAGRQFDPLVVAALESHLADGPRSVPTFADELLAAWSS